MNITAILRQIDKGITSQKERVYFLIHEARYNKILTEIKNLNPHIVLDVGCYPYHIGKALELMGCKVYGISSTHEPIKHGNVTVLNIETDRFPYASNFFDLVLCTEVVEHLPHSPLPAIKEMYRVTKKGGHIILTTPNITRSINQGKMLLGRSPMYGIDAYFDQKGKGSNLYHRHNREYTLSELKALAHHAGWTIERAKHFIGYPPFRRRNKTDNALLRAGKVANYLAMAAIPRLRDTLLVIASK